MLISLLLGVLVGAVLGLTGAGGGILAVPALVVGLGWSMQQAAPVALIAVAGGAGIGALDGFRQKLVRYRAAALMAVIGIPVTALGIRAAQAVSQPIRTNSPPSLIRPSAESTRRRGASSGHRSRPCCSPASAR